MPARMTWMMILGVVVAMGGTGVSLRAASNVPFSDAFDYPGGTALAGTNGWLVSGSGTATAVDGHARFRGVTLRNAFVPTCNAVAITIDVQPLFMEQAPGALPGRFNFYVGTNGLVTAYDGNTPTMLTHTPIMAGETVRFVVRVDYPMQNWSLWLEGAQIASGLQLASGDETSTFEELGFVENSDGDYAYVDAVSIAKTQSASTFVLPFVEPFDTLEPGDLHGQRDWWATYAVVQGGLGGRVCALTSQTARIEHAFTGAGAYTNVWTQCVVRPARGAAPSPPAGTTFAFFVDADGAVVAYDGQTPVVVPGPRISDGMWARFTTYSDYGTGRWDLYLGHTRIAEGLAFYDETVTSFAAFGLFGAGDQTVAYVDDIRVSETRPPFGATVFIVR